MPSITKAKLDYEARLNSYMDKYSKVIFTCMDNVTSQQMHKVRRGIRGTAEFLMGKKTLQSKILSCRAESTGASKLDKEFYNVCKNKSLLKCNTGLIFTNNDTSFIKEILDANRIHAPSRVGAIAPCDVIIPAGNTGMEPTTTSFFQALNIPTKISKGTVEIISDKKVLNTGDIVDNSTAVLLQKLNISPFYYQVTILHVWDNGTLFTQEDLAITDEVIKTQLVECISNLSSMIIGAGIPTENNVGAFIADAFKTLLGASVATNYEFDEYDGKNLRKAALEAKSCESAAASVVAVTQKVEAAPAAVQEEEDEEDDMGFGNLF